MTRKNLKPGIALLSLLLTLAALSCFALPSCGGGSSVSSLAPAGSLSRNEVVAARGMAAPALSEEAAAIGLEDLGQMEQLPGVGPEISERLVSALREAFNSLSQDGRWASAATSLMQVGDLKLTASVDGTAILNWSYHNNGDYDQSSEVNISDLAIVGMFFGATSESADWDRAQIADGDGNGEVNAADVVPIAQNYLGRITHYTLYSTMTPEDENSWTAFASVDVSEGAFPDGAYVKQFSYSLPAPEQGMSYRVEANGDDVPATEAHTGSVALFDASNAGKPQNLVATQGTLKGQVKLTWDELEGTLLYEIFRAATADGAFEKLGSKAAGNPQYFDFDVQSGQHYFYYVHSLLEAGYSADADIAEGWGLDLPVAPENVSASDGDFEDYVRITWSPVPSATNYQVSRADAADGDYTALGTTDLMAFSDETVDWGIAYFYRVQAVNPVGVSQASAADQGNSGVLGNPPAVVSVSPLTGTEGVPVTFNAVIDGNEPGSYLWDFGGAAAASTQASPTVQMGAPGTYNCSLTVANDWGGDQFPFVLSVNAQNSSISDVAPLSGVESTSVTFSATHTGEAVESWSWDFGGGANPDTSTDATPTVQLGTVGSYNASVSVQTSSGTDSYFFTLEVIAGVPNLVSVMPVSGDAGETISPVVTNTGGSVDSWAWDFGGGATPNTSTVENPSVTLAGGGNYSCSVTAMNSKGSSTYQFTLNVIPPKPIITGVSPTTGVAGSAISPHATNVGGVASSYAWYFGGGASPNSSALETPTVTLGAEGTYNCSVVVTNINGSVLFPFTLTVTPPPPNLTGVAPNTGVSGATLLPVASNTGGDATSWSWNFGGGASPNTSTAPNPAITLGSPGTYSASVTATNNAGSSTVNFSLTVNVAPPEITSVSPQSGYEGDSATFNASNNGGDATSWVWNFGGGATPNTSTDASPMVTLGSPGSYDCSVIATNASGSDTYNFTLAVAVQPPSLTAVNHTSGTEGTTITMSATNDGGAADSWTWDFDGGASPGTSTDASPSITLGSPGTYDMSVIAQNSSGTSLFEFTFTVTAVPPDVTGVSPTSGVEGTSLSPVPVIAGGTATSWSWNFGGGATPNTSTDQTPTITLGSEGTYSASVTATNSGGSDTYNFTLTVDPAAPDINVTDPIIGMTGSTITPSASNTGGTVASWSWNFGGGASPNTSTSATPSVVLGTPGTYSASVTATNTTGSDTATFTLTVNPLPPSISGVSPMSGVTGTTYSPIATNTGGTATSWSWNFGGGATPGTSSDAAPSVTLHNPGTYSVSVTATNISGSDTYNYTLTVNPEAPVITDVTPTSGTEGDSVTFALTTSGGVATSWSWDFDGGATPGTSTDESPTVTLGTAGTYNCSVTATNVTGSDTYNFTLTVNSSS